MIVFHDLRALPSRNTTYLTPKRPYEILLAFIHPRGIKNSAELKYFIIMSKIKYSVINDRILSHNIVILDINSTSQ